MLTRVLRRWQPIATIFRQIQRTQNFQIHLEAVTSRKNEKDLLLTNIKSASTSFEVFDLISRNDVNFSAEDTVTVLNSLYLLQKSSGSIKSSNMLQNSNFEQLCRSLKRNSRNMQLNDVLKALKILPSLGVKSNSDVMMSLLHQVKHQINDLSLEQIVYLQFDLQRMESSPLVDLLTLALPTLLQIQIGTKMDHEHLPQLTNLLKFISHFKVSDQCMFNVVNAITLHGQDLSISDAKYVIWSLSETKFRSLNEISKKILANAIEVLKRDFNKEVFETHNVTLSRMIAKYKKGFVEFYDESLYDKFAEWIVMNDSGFMQATFIQKQLNEMNFVNMKLIKYMINEVVRNPQYLLEATPITALTFVCALSQANYKPDNWSEIYPLILQSEFITSGQIFLPWIKFATELLSLDVECPLLWNKIFNNEFLDQFLQRKNRHFDLIDLLSLYQNVKVLTTYDIDSIDANYLTEAKKILSSRAQFPLKIPVEFAFGGSRYVYTNVKTDVGQVLDHVIVFDTHSKEELRIPDDQNNFDVFYNDIKVDDDSRKCVAVMTLPPSCYCLNTSTLKGKHALKIRAYEKLGIPVLVVNIKWFSKLPSSEKIPYIEREVKFKL